MSEPERDELSQQNSDESPQTHVNDTPSLEAPLADDSFLAEQAALSQDDTPVFLGIRARMKAQITNDQAEEAVPEETPSMQEAQEIRPVVVPSDAELERMRFYFGESITADEVIEEELVVVAPAPPVAATIDAYDTPVILEAVSIPEEIIEETETHETTPPAPVFPYRDFEELTLAEALGQFRQAPLATLKAFFAVTRMPDEAAQKQPALRPAYATAGTARASDVVLPGLRRPHVRLRTPAEVEDVPQLEDSAQNRRAGLQLVLRVVAFLLAWFGSVTMLTAADRTESGGLAQGMPLLLLGLIVWLVAEFVGDRTAASAEPTTDSAAPARMATIVLITRIVMLVGACVLGAVSVAYNIDNRFTLAGVIAWAGSVAFAVAAFWPGGWSLRGALESAGRVRLRINWVFIALVAIMLIGSYFRLKDINLIPREMTSDHVEMLNDVHRLLQGTTEVFFASNGGREPMQFYALALFSQLPGLSLDFSTLKLLGALESILTIPVMYWMAKTVIGERERRLGTLVGLLTAAFVATSYWHVTISRMGERIVLMPLATALLILFLARALRYNRRMDFILTGLVLGAGLYTYQAFRMAVVVMAIAGFMALIFYRRRQQVRRLVMNFAACAVIAFLIFLPLFAFSVENPEHFWMRTSGRLFGDALTQTTDENGNIIYRDPTLPEQLTSFQQNVPVLLNNIRNALLMYNWRGDVAWIQSNPNSPALDPITGGLFVVGVAAWIGRLMRRRDLFTWLFPLMFFIMLLPSALAIGMPIENPSATRISGTLPLTFLLVALPLAEILLAARRFIGGIIGLVIAGVVAIGLVIGSYVANQKTYFVDYNQMYMDSSFPYSAGAVYLQAFGESVSYGNAFIINRPGWWDSRAVGIDGGEIDFPNGVPSLADLPTFLEDARERTHRFRFDVNDDILFFYAGDDQATHHWLQQKFPDGFWQLVQPYQPEDTFYTFRVPALGEERYQQLIADAADDDLSQSSG